jgi:hypothetical protein
MANERGNGGGHVAEPVSAPCDWRQLFLPSVLPHLKMLPWRLGMPGTKKAF